MVGLIEKAEHITTQQWFKEEGDEIILLGEGMDLADPLFGLGGSACLQAIHHLKTGTAEAGDPAREKRSGLPSRLIRDGWVRSARMIAASGGWRWPWLNVASRA